MARPFVALALAAALLSPRAGLAQDSRASTRIDARLLEPPPSAPDRRYVDGVIAMIGDRAVLSSTIRDIVNARVAGIYGSGGKVAPSDLEEFAKEAMGMQTNSEILAQSARTSTSLSPDEIKEIVQKEVQRYLDEQVSLAGSYNQYMRDLAAANRTWESVAQEHEHALLRSLSMQDLYLRTRHQTSLLVTPREMKRAYESQRARFVTEGSADVERVLFANEEGGKSAEARAKEAVALWRREPGAKPEEIATRCGGTALSLRKDVRDQASDANAPFVKAFAKAATKGAVSEPILQAGSWWVLRCTARTEARNRKFEDQDVQQEIVEELAKQKGMEQERRLVLRNHRNLYIYPFDLFDR